MRNFEFYSCGINLIGDDIRTIEINVDVLLNACKDIGLAVIIGKVHGNRMSSSHDSKRAYQDR